MGQPKMNHILQNNCFIAILVTLNHFLSTATLSNDLPTQRITLVFRDFIKRFLIERSTRTPKYKPKLEL